MWAGWALGRANRDNTAAPLLLLRAFGPVQGPGPLGGADEEPPPQHPVWSSSVRALQRMAMGYF